MFTFVHWGHIRQGSNLVTDGVRNHHDAALCLPALTWLGTLTGQALCQPRPGQRKVRITQISISPRKHKSRQKYFAVFIQCDVIVMWTRNIIFQIDSLKGSSYLHCFLTFNTKTFYYKLLFLNRQFRPDFCECFRPTLLLSPQILCFGIFAFRIQRKVVLAYFHRCKPIRYQFERFDSGLWSKNK